MNDNVEIIGGVDDPSDASKNKNDQPGKQIGKQPAILCRRTEVWSTIGSPSGLFLHCRFFYAPATVVSSFCLRGWREETLAVRKLRQRSSGMLAMAMSASWLMMNPTSHGNAFCMNP